MAEHLWHYTCQHGRDALGVSGVLLPAASMSEAAADLPPAWFVWLTDMAVPQADALGLTRHLAKCDRMAYRYRATDLEGVTRWLGPARRTMPAPWRDMLESEPGARPAHWWVSRGPVPVVLSTDGNG